MKIYDCIVIGTGISGLFAANKLQSEGLEILVLDKGRGLGGRMATRRITPGVFDHGAQFFTVKNKIFSAFVDEWIENGIVEPWYEVLSSKGRGNTTRYRGAGSMTLIPKFLAKDLNVQLSWKVERISKEKGFWKIVSESDDIFHTNSIILTAPIPQSIFLLREAECSNIEQVKTKLESIQYDPCIAVMALLDGPSKIQPPGSLQFKEGSISWIADNRVKGISPDGGGVTIHGSPTFSRKYWDEDRKYAGNLLLEKASELLHSKVVDFQVHGWRYSKPIEVYDDKFALLEESPPLFLAGDAFLGPRVEGAALSGLAAAGNLLETLK